MSTLGKYLVCESSCDSTGDVIDDTFTGEYDTYTAARDAVEARWDLRSDPKPMPILLHEDFWLRQWGDGTWSLFSITRGRRRS